MSNTSTNAANESSLAPSLCPRCQQPLTGTMGLGWCQACGYCKSLEEDRARLPLERPTAKARPVPGSVRRPSPIWAIVLFAGVLVVGVGCFAASRHFAPNPLQRALWTSIQIAAGVGIMICGQFFALMIIAPKEGTLHMFDAFVPFRLYALVFKYQPRTNLTIWLGGWGLTAVFSALIFVGGLGHWLNYLPKSGQSQQIQWK